MRVEIAPVSRQAGWGRELAIAPRRDKACKSKTNVATEPLGDSDDKRLHAMPETGIRLTIEDGTSEETEELDEQVLLLGGDFVPTVALATGLNLVRGDTLLDVGLEHLLGDEAGVGGGCVARVARAPEGVPRLALASIGGVGLSSIGIGGLGVPVGRNVLLQSSVLVWRCLLVASMGMVS
jgi:hypothetical protein